MRAGLDHAAYLHDCVQRNRTMSSFYYKLTQWGMLSLLACGYQRWGSGVAYPTGRYPNPTGRPDRYKHAFFT